MTEPWRAAMGDLLLLSFAAGSADAAGFLHLGNVFTCNMTGNVVLFGLSLGEHHWSELPRFLYVLLMFALGAGAGLRLTRHLEPTEWSPIAARVLSVESILLGCFAVGWVIWSPLPPHGWSALLLGCLTVAMGLQTSALFRFKPPGMQTTALTLTIASFVEAAFHAAGPGQRNLRPRAFFNAGVIGTYALGAMITGFSLFHFPRIIGLVPCAFVLTVFLRNIGAAAKR